jgi:predicted nucleotidyltransferase
MDKVKAVNIVRQYADEVTKSIKPEQIVLFGSYAAGDYRDDSDIDVAVIYNDFHGDFLEVSSFLWSKTRKISSLIEPVLLDRAHDESGFVEEILRTGEVVYHAGL